MLYRTSSNLDDTLDQCIDRLQGGVDIATCLQENQLLADELRPLLQVAAVLPSLPAPQLSQQARNRIRKQMLQAVKTQGQASRRYERQKSSSLFGFAMRFALVLVVVMLAMGSG
ncbi:MAG TPA: hypothetical protein VFT58_06650, partial [Nitrososphaera sp.]|nr:hypothetical protein [Nitrososphaera sp.]